MQKLTMWIALLLAVAGATAARAEVQKRMNPCGAQRLCAAYRLLLTPPAGWVIDEDATAERGVQILVPKGETFESAPALIYVQVSYHPDKAQTPAEFARVSNGRWQAEVPDSKIAERPSVDRASGKPAFLRFSYDNQGKQGQQFELGAFAPDGDGDGNEFMLDIMLVGDKAAVDRAEPTYVAWLKGL